MRIGLAALAVAIGCGAPVQVPALPEMAPPFQDPVFLERTAMLHATLERNSIKLDPPPVIDTCDDASEDLRCSRCEVATGMDGIDPDLLDRVAIAISAYPAVLLTAMAIEHIALCKQIRYLGKETGPGGQADLDTHRLLISVEYFTADAAPRSITVEEIVHHELFHLLDHAQLGDNFMGDPEWATLKPPGFEYRDPAVMTTRQPGFVNAYATTDEAEDRASVYQFLMARPDTLCEIAQADPIVQAKVAMIWLRVAAITGDAFLRKHAPCVDWVSRELGPQPATGPRTSWPKVRLDDR
jgi:hypothetical protein